MLVWISNQQACFIDPNNEIFQFAKQIHNHSTKLNELWITW